MRGLCNWLLMLGLFASANVVGAGTVLVLGMTVNRIHPGAMEELVWPWFLAGGAGVAAAVLFLRGAMAGTQSWRSLYTRT